MSINDQSILSKVAAIQNTRHATVKLEV